MAAGDNRLKQSSSVEGRGDLQLAPPVEERLMSVHPALDARTARLLPWIVAIAFFMQTLDGTILKWSGSASRLLRR